MMYNLQMTEKIGLFTFPGPVCKEDTFSGENFQSMEN